MISIFTRKKKYGRRVDHFMTLSERNQSEQIANAVSISA